MFRWGGGGLREARGGLDPPCPAEAVSVSRSCFYVCVLWPLFFTRWCSILSSEREGSALFLVPFPWGTLYLLLVCSAGSCSGLGETVPRQTTSLWGITSTGVITLWRWSASWLPLRYSKYLCSVASSNKVLFVVPFWDQFFSRLLTCYRLAILHGYNLLPVAPSCYVLKKVYIRSAEFLFLQVWCITFHILPRRCMYLLHLAVFHGSGYPSRRHERW